jgi:hypothetical protein
MPSPLCAAPVTLPKQNCIMGGSAIIAVAEKLKETIRTAAALRLNCAAEDICGRSSKADSRRLARGRSFAVADAQAMPPPPRVIVPAQASHLTQEFRISSKP